MEALTILIMNMVFGSMVRQAKIPIWIGLILKMMHLYQRQELNIEQLL